MTWSDAAVTLLDTNPFIRSPVIGGKTERTGVLEQDAIRSVILAVIAEQQHQGIGGARGLWRCLKRLHWKRVQSSAMMVRMDSPPFGVQVTVAGIKLQEEWQALAIKAAQVLTA